MARLLVEHKSNLMHRDQNKKTALYYAKLHGHMDICNLFIRSYIEDKGKKFNVFENVMKHNKEKDPGASLMRIFKR